jgi:mono/diheme cytochrome c family protein
MRCPKLLINKPLLLVLPFCVLALTGCRQDMHDQPKYKPLGETAFFPDKRQSRPDIANTIARGDLRDGDPEFYTGKSSKDAKADVEVFPIAVTQEFIERGHQRFDVFCSPCHGRLGNGLGMIVRRGFKQPPSYHIERLRTAPVGHFYDVITNGYGAMYNYAAQVTPRDRWAIISYIRALQFSENQKVDQLSAEAKAKLPARPSPDEEPILPGLPSDQLSPSVGDGSKAGAMNK